MTNDELNVKRAELAAQIAGLEAVLASDSDDALTVAAAISGLPVAKAMLERLDDKLQTAERAELRRAELAARAIVERAVAAALPAALEALRALDAALEALSQAATRDSIAAPIHREVVAGLLLLKRELDAALVDMRRHRVDGLPAARPAQTMRPAVKVSQRESAGPLRLTGRGVSATVDARARRPALR